MTENTGDAGRNRPKLLTNAGERDRKDYREIGLGGVDGASAAGASSGGARSLSEDAWLHLLEQLCELNEQDFDSVVVAARAAKRFEERDRSTRHT